MRTLPGEPLFIADWAEVLMVHYEVDPLALRAVVPFELDLWQGRAFVSTVAFSMRGMRPRLGGRFTASLFKPLASHHFLNVRTYVKHRGEDGIFFMAEWLSSRLSVSLGPLLFGLPYHYARIAYGNNRRQVIDSRGCGVYDLELASPNEFSGPLGCTPGSMTEWLMERYTAFTHMNGKARFFRVWHPPWQQVPQRVEISEQSLLETRWPFFRRSQILGANYSRGLRDVWMGWPHAASVIGNA
jgi:uncharacterized protein YqjF (DUF2071 family)